MVVVRRRCSVLGIHSSSPHRQPHRVFDDSLAAIAKVLKKQNFVVVDGFLPPDQARQMRKEIKCQYDEGRMAPGVLGGGKSGSSTACTPQFMSRRRLFVAQPCERRPHDVLCRCPL